MANCCEITLQFAKGIIVAMVRGTKASDVIARLMGLPEESGLR